MKKGLTAIREHGEKQTREIREEKVVYIMEKGLTAIRTRDLPICSRPPYHLATNPLRATDE
jgi:hypothetical protein